MIQTVRGKIDPKALGNCYCHEHLSMDLTPVRGDLDSRLFMNQTLIKELQHLKKAGVSSLVEVTNMGMGQNVNDLLALSIETDVNIIASVGFYQEKYYPEWLKQSNVKEIEAHLMAIISHGFNETGIKPGILAEIGTSFNEMTPQEERVFKACASVHSQTGIGISTHTEMATYGLAQTHYLLDRGVDPQKLIIGHMDLKDNIKEQVEILKTGTSIAFDTIGKQSYRRDHDRVLNLIHLLELGFEDQIALSQDITRQSHLKDNGGIGFTYLVNKFIPDLRTKGVPEVMIKKMMSANMMRILDFC